VGVQTIRFKGSVNMLNDHAALNQRTRTDCKANARDEDATPCQRGHAANDKISANSAHTRFPSAAIIAATAT
jgi:hypothetical protein